MKRLDTTALPEALAALATEWARILGLGEWELTMALDDRPDGDAAVRGASDPSAAYLRAHIDIRRTLELPKQRETLVHELLHVVLAHISLTVSRIVDLLPKDQQAHARRLYRDAEEATIERLRRALMDHLEGAVDAG